MNTLRLEFTLTYIDEHKMWDFDCQAYVNDKRFMPKYHLDIWDIERTYLESGKYALFVCGCGDEGCAGIFQTPQITVGENVIYWHIFAPQECILRFDKAQYIAAIKELREKMLNFYTMEQWAKIPYFFSQNVANLPLLKGRDADT